MIQKNEKYVLYVYVIYICTKINIMYYIDILIWFWINFRGKFRWNIKPIRRFSARNAFVFV